MHFTRTLSVKYHSTGDHYFLSIPRPVAEALNLHEDGGLVSIEVLDHNKKESSIVLKAYRDSDFAWREQFDLVHGPSDLKGDFLQFPTLML